MLFIYDLFVCLFLEIEAIGLMPGKCSASELHP